MGNSRFVAVLSFAALIFGSMASAEDQSSDQLSADAVKRFRALEQSNVPQNARALTDTAAAPTAQSWTLSPDITKNSRGTFGIDISHYDTKGCTFTWQKIIDVGLRFVYDEVTRGAVVTDQSVVDTWNQLEPLHASKQLFRGAYHFLMPNADEGSDATAQAQAFLGAIGAVNGKMPIELPPIVDIEPTNTPVTKDSVHYNSCKQAGYLKHDSRSDRYTCDDWYTYISTNKRQNIVALAQSFASAVKAATDQDTIVYSGLGAWSEVMGGNANLYRPLLTGRAVWMSRYTVDGSNQKQSGWGTADWNAQWNMPVMFGGASYPMGPAYNVPDFWQFAQYGRMSRNPSSCADLQGNMDLNYIPVRDTQFETVFGIH